MKYLYLISIFFIFSVKNLSAYQEITIQKDSDLQNYQELLGRMLDFGCRLFWMTSLVWSSDPVQRKHFFKTYQKTCCLQMSAAL